jgi:two-component system, NarL family, sensor kinase
MEIIIIAGTLFFLLITSFLVASVLINRKQHAKYVREKEEMKAAYHKEILKAKLEMQEQTLHTIATDIHDGVGQILSLAKLHLNTIKVEENTPTAFKIIDAKELVTRAIRDLRHLSKTLNTDFLSKQKLTDSIQLELGHIQKTKKYSISFEITGIETALDPQKELILFRIIQESLNNIIKHANAKQLSVTLDYQPKQLLAVIEDDGVGFIAEEIPTKAISDKGTGIGNMYHRAKLIGAEFSINSEINKGTTSKLLLPI